MYWQEFPEYASAETVRQPDLDGDPNLNFAAAMPALRHHSFARSYAIRLHIRRMDNQAATANRFTA